MVNQDGEGIRDVGISNGRIAAIGGLDRLPPLRRSTAGLHSCPRDGTQVHFRDRADAKEDLETVIAQRRDGAGPRPCFEMPNTDPLPLPRHTFTDKVKRGHHRMHCDFAFFIGGTRENVADLPELGARPAAPG